MLFDARLSDVGMEQVRATREQLRSVAVDLVITSPLTRALQTAVGLFSDHPSAPAILVEALHRERVENISDIGSNPALLSREFPSVRLDHLPEVWWHASETPDERGITVEPIEAVQVRAATFKDLLLQRSEQTIAVVGHGTFFYHLLGKALANCEIAELVLERQR